MCHPAVGLSKPAAEFGCQVSLGGEARTHAGAV